MDIDWNCKLISSKCLLFHPQANCKGCQYDAANSETSLNDCLEYGQKESCRQTKRKEVSVGRIVRMLIVLSAQLQVVNHLEHVCFSFCSVRSADDCQLLRNLNPQQHFYQQQQQQPQQPDVMLMTTTSGSALLKYAPQQQQLQQQQQLSTATLPRQHHQMQLQQQQQQLQQNFVAVPSSMLRMPLTVPPNCYAPATATIYFPFGHAPPPRAVPPTTKPTQPRIRMAMHWETLPSVPSRWSSTTRYTCNPHPGSIECWLLDFRMQQP